MGGASWDGIMTTQATKEHRIADLYADIAWWTERATYWQSCNEVEYARCMRIVDRAFEEIGRIEAGIEVAS
jgi:hypothetical protein